MNFGEYALIVILYTALMYTAPLLLYIFNFLNSFYSVFNQKIILI